MTAFLADRAVRLVLIASLALLIIQACALAVMGRPWICDCGFVKFWHGIVKSSGNSQHLTDWYTFTHVVHGFLFYAALHFLTPSWSLPQRLLAAVAIEVTWEVIENSSFIIERYRAETISLEYYGDTVINSVADTLAMVVGFALAAWWPVWLSIASVVGSELFLAYAIRDNLTLNIIMLLWPMDAIKAWQAAGGPL
ncbi:MAG: DUF2585 domain-containing protein [Alphaproteobacteria bacterium]|nr:DUF2585 domain-containing protein [Alphaproteobacteria bacterium]